MHGKHEYMDETRRSPSTGSQTGWQANEHTHYLYPCYCHIRTHNVCEVCVCDRAFVCAFVFVCVYEYRSCCTQTKYNSDGVGIRVIASGSRSNAIKGT